MVASHYTTRKLTFRDNNRPVDAKVVPIGFPDEKSSLKISSPFVIPIGFVSN